LPHLLHLHHFAAELPEILSPIIGALAKQLNIWFTLKVATVSLVILAVPLALDLLQIVLLAMQDSISVEVHAFPVIVTAPHVLALLQPAQAVILAGLW